MVQIAIRGSQNLSWEEWKQTGSLLLCTARQSVEECHNSTKYLYPLMSSIEIHIITCIAVSTNRVLKQYQYGTYI